MLARVKILMPVLAGLALLAGAGAAAAQCCAPPPPCCQPPPPPPPPSPPCCGGHTVNTPGVNVSVHSTAVAVAGASARAGAGGSAGGMVFVGGTGSWSAGPPQPSLIPLLNVEAEAETEVKLVAYTATRQVRRRMVLQAACVDDRNVPHPASQVRPDRDVFEDYDGELWRCIAGTRLQVTWADYEQGGDFSKGETIACAKGEALYHAPGGQVACRSQRPARECNERSLLRRYGAGLKVLTMTRTETYTDYREETVVSASASAKASGIVLDGGVGGIVY